MSYAVYVYTDVNESERKIRSDEVNWLGTWTASGSYFASSYDAVAYADQRFVAIVDNVGANPVTPSNQPNPFSQLVIIQAGDEPPFAPPTTPSYGTISTSTAVAGTIAYSFTGSACQVTTVDQDVWIKVVNQTPGAEMEIALIANGTIHQLSYDAFQWFGSSPPGHIQNKSVLLCFLAVGTVASDVLASASLAL